MAFILISEVNRCQGRLLASTCSTRDNDGGSTGPGGRAQSAVHAAMIAAPAVAHRSGEPECELNSHEPVRVCPHHLRLAPDRGGQSGRQRRRDRSRARRAVPTATSCSSRSCASPATPAPICSASRRCSTPGIGHCCGSPRRPRAASSSWSSGRRSRPATACSTALS